MLPSRGLGPHWLETTNRGHPSFELATMGTEAFMSGDVGILESLPMHWCRMLACLASVVWRDDTCQVDCAPGPHSPPPKIGRWQVYEILFELFSPWATSVGRSLTIFSVFDAISRVWSATGFVMVFHSSGAKVEAFSK